MLSVLFQQFPGESQHPSVSLFEYLLPHLEKSAQLKWPLINAVAAGFQQARMIPAKPGIAFVDFATEMQVRRKFLLCGRYHETR